LVSMDRSFFASSCLSRPLRSGHTRAELGAWFIWSISSFWFVSFVWLNQTNQMNQINQMNLSLCGRWLERPMLLLPSGCTMRDCRMR
jgi:hypothetical protein